MADDLPDIQPVYKKGDTVEGMRVMSEIGRGAASVIYLVQDTRSKQIWALKHVQKRNAKEQRFLDQAESEPELAFAINATAPGSSKRARCSTPASCCW